MERGKNEIRTDDKMVEEDLRNLKIVSYCI